MLKSVILLQISRSFVLVMTDFADVILKKKRGLCAHFGIRLFEEYWKWKKFEFM